jgi:hypothetical protein
MSEQAYPAVRAHVPLVHKGKTQQPNVGLSGADRRQWV